MYASMRTKAQAMGYTDKDLAAFTPDVRRTLGFDRKLDDTTGTESTAVSPQSVGTVDMRASVGGVEKHREDTKGPAVTGPNASARAEHSATTPVHVVATPVTENKHAGCAENGGGGNGNDGSPPPTPPPASPPPATPTPAEDTRDREPAWRRKERKRKSLQAAVNNMKNLPKLENEGQYQRWRLHAKPALQLVRGILTWVRIEDGVGTLLNAADEEACEEIMLCATHTNLVSTQRSSSEDDWDLRMLLYSVLVSRLGQGMITIACATGIGDPAILLAKIVTACAVLGPQKIFQWLARERDLDVKNHQSLRGYIAEVNAIYDHYRNNEKEGTRTELTMALRFLKGLRSQAKYRTAADVLLMSANISLRGAQMQILKLNNYNSNTVPLRISPATNLSISTIDIPAAGVAANECFAWLRGYCNKGTDCKYGHIEGKKGTKKSTEGNKGSSGAVGRRNRPRVPSKICFNFRDTGTCKFGDKCHFIHSDITKPESTPVSTVDVNAIENKELSDFFEKYKGGQEGKHDMSTKIFAFETFTSKSLCKNSEISASSSYSAPGFSNVGPASRPGSPRVKKIKTEDDGVWEIVSCPKDNDEKLCDHHPHCTRMVYPNDCSKWCDFCQSEEAINEGDIVLPCDACSEREDPPSETIIDTNMTVAGIHLAAYNADIHVDPSFVKGNGRSDLKKGTIVDSGALVCIWTEENDIHRLQNTSASLMLADGKSVVKGDGMGYIVTGSGIKLPVILVRAWPRNYISVRVLARQGYRTIMGDTVTIQTRAKMVHSGSGPYSHPSEISWQWQAIHDSGLDGGYMKKMGLYFIDLHVKPPVRPEVPYTDKDTYNMIAEQWGSLPKDLWMGMSA